MTLALRHWSLPEEDSNGAITYGPFRSPSARLSTNPSRGLATIQRRCYTCKLKIIRQGM
jgi:hypothetical protein